jgi:flagellar hook assembly protein FlgD
LTLNNADQYEFKLTSTDSLGGSVTVSSIVTIGNLKLSMNVRQFNPSQAANVTFTTIVPVNLLHTILIKNGAGQSVRTLIQNVSRNAGTYNDIWDGRNNSGQLVPDGPYFYVAQVTINSTLYTLDFTNIFPNTAETKITPTVSSSSDYYNNVPLSVNYTVPQLSRTVICFAPIHLMTCVPPGGNEFQMVQFEYQESGARTYQWLGADLNGSLHRDAKYVLVLSYVAAVGSVFVLGTKPTVSAFTITPNLFSPFKLNQNLSITFSTYQSQTVTITTSFRNVQSLSVLRTIVLNGVAPGQANISWNGRADNGMWVSPGVYLATVTIQDPLGNSVSRQLLTTLKY